MNICILNIYLLIVGWQLQANMQQRIDNDRKELEQGHVRIVKEYESRVRDFDNTNRVSSLCITRTLHFDRL